MAISAAMGRRSRCHGPAGRMYARGTPASALPCPPGASATGRDRSPPVHGGYRRCRQVAECNGHQRSRRELRNRRSGRERSRHQAPLQAAGRSSSLPPGCREPSGLLPTSRWTPRTGLTLRPSWEPSPPRANVVLLGNRATHVPQAAVTSGIQRTVTVSRRGPMAWAVGSDLGWGRRPKLHGMQGVELCRGFSRLPSLPESLEVVSILLTD